MAATSAGTWMVKVMTDHSQLTRILQGMDQIKADIAAIKADNSLRNELLRDSIKEPGKVVQLQRDQEAVWREFIKLYAATYATEPEHTRKAKRAAALEFKEAYDGRVHDLRSPAPPIEAYTEVTRKSAVP